MKTIRVFIAHSKQDPDSFLDDVKRRVSTTLQNAAIARGKSVTIEAVLGRDDHAENFKRCGSWDAWAQDVIDRLDYVTRDPVYGAIVVTGRFIGKATSQIVQWSLAVRRPTLLFGDDGTLRPIREVRLVSSDFRAGWEVIAS